MPIHGDPSLGPHRFEAYHYPDGVPTRVYQIPFVDEVRTLANQCLARYPAMNNGRELSSDNPRCDQEARSLAQTGFAAAARDAMKSGNTALYDHLTDLLMEMPKGNGTYLWLLGLACDGGGLRPRAET